jgi:hypothetical protein
MARVKKFIQGAIKRPGALTARAKSHNRTTTEQAQVDVKSGTTLQKQQANFFLTVLKKAAKGRRKKTLIK